MRQYLDCYEKRLVETMGGQAEEYLMVIRYEITDYTDHEINQSVRDLQELLTPSYKIVKHYCFHDEDPNKPCRIEVVMEVEQ